MKLISADKLLSKLGGKKENQYFSEQPELEVLHNYGVNVFNQLHDKVTKIVEECEVNWSDVIDVEKLKSIIIEVCKNNIKHQLCLLGMENNIQPINLAKHIINNMDKILHEF